MTPDRIAVHTRRGPARVIDLPVRGVVGGRGIHVPLAAGLFVCGFLVPSAPSRPLMWACLALFYVYFAMAIARPTQFLSGIPTIFTIETLFLSFSYLLFFWPYQLYVLGAHDLAHTRFVTETFADQSNRALVLSTVGVVAFHAGVHWKRAQSTAAQSAGASAGRVPTSDPDDHLPLLTLVGLVLVIGVYLGLGLRSAGEGRYTGSARGGVVADGIADLIMMLSILAVAQAIARRAQGRRMTPAVVTCCAIACAWSVRTLVAGDRNSFLLVALAGVGGVVTFVRPAKRRTVLILLPVALVVYNAVETSRSGGGSGALIEELVRQVTGRESLVDTSGDTSFNVSTVNTRSALARVPSLVPFGFGRYTLIGLAGMLPFLRGAVLDPDEYSSSAEVLTFINLGPNPSWGVGTNVIADLYIDFGYLGIPIGMFCVGLVVGWLNRRTIRSAPSTRSIMIYLMGLALLAEVPRYSVAFPVRMMVWAYLFIRLTEVVLPRPTVGAPWTRRAPPTQPRPARPTALR